MNMSSLSCLVIIFLFLTTVPVKAAFLSTETFINQGGRIQRGQVLLNDDILLYDEGQQRFVSIINLKQTAKLRIAVMDTNFRVIKVFRAPEGSTANPFVVENIDFIPTDIVKDVKQPGMLVLQTNRGDLIVNLVTLRSEFVVFGLDFFDGKHEVVPVRELRKPIYAQ